MPQNDFYAITFGHDEIGIRPSKCLTTNICNCKSGGAQCGYSAADAQQYIINYYQQRADYIRKLTTEQFIRDCGYYG